MKGYNTNNAFTSTPTVSGSVLNTSVPFQISNIISSGGPPRFDLSTSTLTTRCKCSWFGMPIGHPSAR